jgi:hypothetical protein
MSSQSLDYVRKINALAEELLRLHGDLLERKNIRRKHELIQVIKLDLDKLAHAFIEVKENRAAPVLQKFFSGSGLDYLEICSRIAGGHIYHVGFEIHEPLDLVLYGIRHWVDQSRSALEADMQLSNFFRFPASAAFQKRVAAPAEIMRLWLQVNERSLMLELFDIHRPADSFLNGWRPKLTHRNFNALHRPEDYADGHEQRLSQLFAADQIWHYAFYVRTPGDVMDLHSQLQNLASPESGYSMPYIEPVHNRGDRSFHTKIIRKEEGRQNRLELEFVTQYAPGEAA